ncbi:MAG: hypothetical protein K8L97_12885 [Anaerolineae bacterium]|nr:hypothetical protein [Anaerolineae bacterium]
MSDITLEQEIMDVVRKLNIEEQRTVLEQARRLAEPKGEPGWLFLERTQNIHIAADDLKLMEQAIEEAFEKIDDLPEVKFDE